MPLCKYLLSKMNTHMGCDWRKDETALQVWVDTCWRLGLGQWTLHSVSDDTPLSAHSKGIWTNSFINEHPSIWNIIYFWKNYKKKLWMILEFYGMLFFIYENSTSEMLFLPVPLHDCHWLCHLQLYIDFFLKRIELRKKFEFPAPKDCLCQVWLKLVQWFWRQRWKCYMFMTMTTTIMTADNRQILIRKAHLSLWWTKKSYECRNNWLTDSWKDSF